MSDLIHQYEINTNAKLQKPYQNGKVGGTQFDSRTNSLLSDISPSTAANAGGDGEADERDGEAPVQP
jgi:hypothetical protein